MAERTQRGMVIVHGLITRRNRKSCGSVGAAGRWLGICLASLAALAAAADPEAITLTVGEGLANPGNTVEIDVSLRSEADSPSTLVLYLEYDADRVAPDESGYELILRDLTGEPLEDNDGNVLTRLSAVRPGAVVEATNRSVDYEDHGGVLALSIAGANDEILDGVLFTVAFEVFSGVTDLTPVPLTLASEEAPVQLIDADSGTSLTVFSTAATGAAEAIPLRLNAGSITLACTPPETPTGVVASEGRADGVQLTWTPVAGENITYRVYRSEENEVSTARPLGEAWQSGAVFLDITAEAPEEVSPGMCWIDPVYEEQRYYYWVKARSAEACEGEFSATAAQGYRGAAKAFYGKQAVAAPEFPSAGAGGDPVISARQAVAVRLESALPVAESSLWITIEGAGEDYQAEWLPDTANNARGGWVRCTPVTYWPEGAQLKLCIGGEDSAGRAVGPVLRAYQVAPGEQAASGIGAKNSEVIGEPAEAFSALPEGLGEICRIAPDGPYAQPQRCWLPLPEGVDAAAVGLYYHASHAGYAGWYSAETVAHFLAAGPDLEVVDGQTGLAFEVRFGGVVQLGPKAGPKPSAAAVSLPRQSRIGDALLAALLLTGLFLGALRTRPNTLD